MHISLDRKGATPLYSQVAQEIQQRIRTGTLPPGSRLPTIRALARQLSVTRLTIHTAYNELQAGGWVEATVGRGTFVATNSEALVSPSDIGREVSVGGVLNDMLRMAQIPGIRSFAMADAAPEILPQREFRRALDEAFVNSGSSLLSYGTAHGDPVLRTALVPLLEERGIHASPDEIIITAGVTQGLNLIARTLAHPGDTVIVEHPTYLGALNILSHAGLHVVGAPLDASGLDLEALEALIQAHRPRFLYVVPTFQNPTGITMGSERRARLLALAEQHNLPIVEDDLYAPLSFDGPAPRALAAGDRCGLVMHLSSFSKILLPGVRIGYLHAAPHWIARLVQAKQATDLCSPMVLQRAIAIFLQRGWLASHLRRSVPLYKARRNSLLDAMSRFFPSGVRWTEPQGGFCVWVTLPQHISVTDLYMATVERGVAFAPGDVFFAGQAPRPYMRLAYSTMAPEHMPDAIRILGDTLSAQLVRRSFVREGPTDYVPLV
jgi:DNA-binding transcriptional MocR family regulator